MAELDAQEMMEILLVEDNAGDARLTMEALKEAKVRNRLRVVRDGEEAVMFLRRQGGYSDVPRPNLILLDLNLPKKDGREVLAEIKSDDSLRRIPTVVLTSSQDNQDVIQSYSLHANCYVVKPLDLDRYIEAVRSIEEFWLGFATLPKNGKHSIH
jgi:CheY-like chemotaxis protein